MVPAGITAWRNGQRAIIPVGIQNRFRTWKEDTADSSERGMYQGTTASQKSTWNPIRQIPRRPYPRPFIIILNCSTASLPSPRSLFSHRTTVHPLPRSLDRVPWCAQIHNLIILTHPPVFTAYWYEHKAPHPKTAPNRVLKWFISTLKGQYTSEMKPWAQRKSASPFPVSSAFVTLLRRPLNPVLGEYVIIAVKPLAN